MYDAFRDALGLEEDTMLFVIISLSTAIFQLFILVLFYKKSVQWFMVLYLLVIFIYNVTYYKVFTVPMGLSSEKR